MFYILHCALVLPYLVIVMLLWLIWRQPFQRQMKIALFVVVGAVLLYTATYIRLSIAANSGAKTFYDGINGRTLSRNDIGDKTALCPFGWLQRPWPWYDGVPLQIVPKLFGEQCDAAAPRIAIWHANGSVVMNEGVCDRWMVTRFPNTVQWINPNNIKSSIRKTIQKKRSINI